MKLRLHAAPATVVSVALIVALAAAGLVAVSSASTSTSRAARARRSARAASPQPSCGDTITADTTLRHDLLDCPNNGIVIGADNITLDLNGHTIDGDGAPAGGCDPVADFCDTGVANFRHDGVTVMHGSIRQFVAGFNFGKARQTRLVGVSTSGGIVGIQLFGSSRILIRNCSGNRTTSSREGGGIAVFDSRHVRILNSSFRDNAHVGIKPVDSMNGVIEGNVVADNGDEGVILEGGEGFRIKRNRLTRNGAGITLGPGSDNVIKRNQVSGGRDGIRIEKGQGNLVAHNLVVGTRQAGIRLGIPHPFLGGAHNVVRRNLVRNSRLDGFLVNPKDDHSLLKHNVARRAGDDGFDIKSRSATLTRNRAARNGDLGIQAVPGVNDGGGNIARHNGDPRQCTNVACN